jgi:signal transduction histidine kinase
MRLSEFIQKKMEEILAQWDVFAATQMPAAAHMDVRALRDHAQQILQAVIKDIATAQTREEQAEKSLGRAPRSLFDAAETAAQTHAFLRARSGFDINQLAGEYRALRASVLRLWMDDSSVQLPDLDDMVRFNEAIDQALAESIGFFSAEVDRARNLFLGMLGHDMRSPLQTVQVTATYLAALNAGEKVSEAASRLINSGAQMKALLDDLVDYNRTKLGLGIDVTPSEVDVRELVADQLAQLHAVYPQRRLNLEASGVSLGSWDPIRLRQLLTNLVVNAIKYGFPDTPVTVTLSGETDVLRLEVKNLGVPIDPLMIAQLFDPLERGSEQAPDEDERGSMGLGLYIAREIAKAHGGELGARSDDGETVFTVSLPRRNPSPDPNSSLPVDLDDAPGSKSSACRTPNPR